jgi:glycosyltransferase involved in cell wall biosynthesis
MIDRLIVRLNTICLTDSPSQSQHLRINGIDISGKPLPVLGKGSLVGVDLERFDPERIRETAQVTRSTLGLSPLHFVVAFVARKSRDKGALDMLQAFALARAESPNMRLLFIGPDESAGEIERMRIATPHLFEGVIERGTVFNHEEYLLASDVLCLPSYREGFGSVVIDAAALGVPCVGSRIAGLVDSVVDGETGLLHAAGDIPRLAELLITLERDRVLLKQLGEHARSRVHAHFSTEHMGKLLVEFYQSHLAGRS